MRTAQAAPTRVHVMRVTLALAGALTVSVTFASALSAQAVAYDPLAVTSHVARPPLDLTVDDARRHDRTRLARL